MTLSDPHQIRSLVISWGCYLGGVETALFHRLQAMNDQGHPAHAFFYYEGQGLANFSAISHMVSDQPEQLAHYINEQRFDVITFINTLKNLDVLEKIEYRGKVLFEFHGETKSIVKNLRFINDFKDHGLIQGIVVPSHNVAAIARQNLRNRPDLPVFVARNTLDTTQFAKRSIGNFVGKYHIPKQWLASPIIGWVGRIEPNKNWRALLRIFHRVRRTHPHIKLLICSDVTVSRDIGLFQETMRHSRLRPGKDYLILPNIPYSEMPFFYNTIAKSGGALLSTSLREGYPYHLLESQACYCPVVCSAIRGSKEIVQHNGTGLVFSLRHESLGKKCMQRLLVDQRLRERLTKNARNSVTVTNRIQTNNTAYINWLKSILSSYSRHCDDFVARISRQT